MVKIPIIHEVVTSLQSLGDAIAGDPQAARNRWHKYAEESLVGSTCAAMHHSIHGDEATAQEYLKGAGRATGQLLLGGGILEDVPVFQELSTAGKSLGDVIGGGDAEMARKRWKTYAENSVIGSTCYALQEDSRGNHKHAKELLANAGKATVSAATTLAVTAATVCTGGAAAPLGVPAAASLGAAMGASTSVASTAVNGLVYDQEFKPGDVVGSGLVGAVGGAVSGGLQANAHAKAVQKITDAERLVDAGEQAVARGDPNKTVSSTMYDKGGDSTVGFNARARGKQRGASNRTAVQVGNGEEVFPGGTPNLDAASSTPAVQSALQKNGGAKWPIRNCAEAHAFEKMKTRCPNVAAESNYTIQMNPTSGPVVKGPCNNCSAMGNTYGRTPFGGADGLPVVDAASSYLDKALAGVAAGETAATLATAAVSIAKK